MSKFYDYIKSKEKEIGKDFFCNIEIAKTGQEDKVIIYYRSFSFNKEENVTVLLVEQNANMALSIADRGYVLETGKIILEGTGKELLSNPEIKKAYLGG